MTCRKKLNQICGWYFVMPKQWLLEFLVPTNHNLTNFFLLGFPCSQAMLPPFSWITVYVASASVHHHSAEPVFPIPYVRTCNLPLAEGPLGLGMHLLAECLPIACRRAHKKNKEWKKAVFQPRVSWFLGSCAVVGFNTFSTFPVSQDSCLSSVMMRSFQEFLCLFWYFQKLLHARATAFPVLQ